MAEFVQFFWLIMVIMAAVCWFLRGLAIGGWLLWFVLSTYLSAVVMTQKIVLAFLTHTVDASLLWTAISMLFLVVMTSILITSRDRKWVTALQLSLLFRLATEVGYALDQPRVLYHLPIAIAMPTVWFLYFRDSRRVKHVFAAKTASKNDNFHTAEC